MKYSVIIPCYNEEENVEELISLLDRADRGYELEWILVENGSKDKTRELLSRECDGRDNFKVVCVDTNRGYGYGLQRGLKKAEGDYVGWLHADMQITPDYMTRFIRMIEDGNYEQHIFLKGKRKNRSIIDCFFTGSMSVIATLLFHTYLSDIGAIPVLFHRELISELTMMPYDFSIETYVYYKAKMSGYKIYRFPVDMGMRKKGKSSWNKGLISKLKQSGIIMRDLIMIRSGKQIL